MIGFNELKNLVRLLEKSNIAVIELKDKQGGIKLTKRFYGTSQATLPGTSNSSNPPAIKLKVDFVQKSKLIGIFLSAPSADAPVFVQVGNFVKEGQAIGMVLTMGLKNELIAEKSGLVKEIHVKDNQPVEFDQPLVTIKAEEEK